MGFPVKSSKIVQQILQRMQMPRVIPAAINNEKKGIRRSRGKEVTTIQQ
jgi:hypothetical protein